MTKRHILSKEQRKGPRRQAQRRKRVVKQGTMTMCAGGRAQWGSGDGAWRHSGSLLAITLFARGQGVVRDSEIEPNTRRQAPMTRIRPTTSQQFQMHSIQTRKVQTGIHFFSSPEPWDRVLIVSQSVGGANPMTTIYKNSAGRFAGSPPASS